MTAARKRKPPPPVRRTRVRKGNHPANPYPVPEARLEDRVGYPFAGPSHLQPAKNVPVEAALSDEAQLGKPPPQPGAGAAVMKSGDEPLWMLRGSDPLAAIVLRLWAGLSADFRTQHPDVLAAARSRALAMDLWRSANRGATP